MLWFYFLNWWKFGMLGFACSFFEFFLHIAFLCVFDVKLLQSTRLRFQRKANTIFHPKKTCSLWLACMNSLIIIMIIHIVMTVYVLRQSAFVYRVCVWRHYQWAHQSVLWNNLLFWGESVNFIKVLMCSFYACKSQKRKKYSQVKQLFSLLGFAGVKAAHYNVDEIEPERGKNITKQK